MVLIFWLEYPGYQTLFIDRVLSRNAPDPQTAFNENSRSHTVRTGWDWLQRSQEERGSPIGQ
jgi:hypothetical protein